MNPVRITVAGAGGRMGLRITALAHQGDGTVVVGAAEYSGHGQVGHDIGTLAGIGVIDVTLSPDLALNLDRTDVVIDFSTPEGTLAYAAAAGKAGIPMVIGTTGLDPAQQAQVAESLAGVPYVQAPNMSVGVNLILKLLAQAATALDDSYDIEVVEMHHRHKIDAPSGTALRMAEVLAEARGISLEQEGVFSRHGQTGPRPRGAIGVQTLRGGDVAGDHTVIFAADGERVEIGHRASGRDTFASGAIRAARWVVGRAPGRYGMQEVLGL